MPSGPCYMVPTLTFIPDLSPQVHVLTNRPLGYFSVAELAVLEIMSQRNYLGHGIITTSDLREARIRHGFHCDRRSVGRSRIHIQALHADIFPRSIWPSQGLTCEQVSDVNPTEPGIYPAHLRSRNGCRSFGPDLTEFEGREQLSCLRKIGHRLRRSLLGIARRQL